MMENVVVISCHCDSKEKLDALEQNIRKLRAIEMNIILVSSIEIPDTVVKKADYSLIISENPVFDWPLKAIGFFRTEDINGKMEKIWVLSKDYGYGTLNHIAKGCKIGLSLFKGNVSFIIYDLEIDDQILDLIKNPKSQSYNFYRSSGIAPHLITLDRELLNVIIEKIDVDAYLSDSGNIAETFLEKLFTDAGVHKSEIILRDSINISSIDFNQSKDPNFDLCFLKDHNKNYEFSILFRKCPEEFKIIINGNDIGRFEFDGTKSLCVNTGLNSHEINDIEIVYFGGIYKATEDLLSSPHSFIAS